MIKLLDILNEALNQQQIVDIAKEFMNSKNYNPDHDCKRSTFEFIKWVKKNKGFEPTTLLLAPPKDIKKFPGKSKDGDSHIFSIIDGYGVDFTANQFPGISEPLKITPENQIPSEYKKIGGYYTSFPDWFENSKTSIKSKFNNLPQWFRDGFEKEGFKPELNESIDKTAGVWDTNEKFKDGSDFKIKFKVSDIIDLAKNTPVKEIDPKSIKYNFSGRQDSDPGKTKERVMKADLSYPIIAVKNENGKIFAMLDGTHRLEKALNLGLDKIKTKVLDKEDLIQFKTDKLKEIKLIDILNEAKKEKETLEDFATTRAAGAAKIADTAKEKGGLALLTYNHFYVKAPYYKKAVEGKLDMEAAKKEFDETYKKISLDMTQIEFQREVGRMEVLGELLIRNKK